MRKAEPNNILSIRNGLSERNSSSDDLELMEREVYEELKMKKEVKRFQDRQRRLDQLEVKPISVSSGLDIDASSAAEDESLPNLASATNRQ